MKKYSIILVLLMSFFSCKTAKKEASITKAKHSFYNDG